MSERILVKIFKASGNQHNADLQPGKPQITRHVL
jgi:hypothetical protein